MQSKTSFFSSGIYRKTVKGLWPLWVIISICLSIVPLGISIEYSYTAERCKNETIDMYYAGISYFVPIATFIYAIIVAMAVWNYLYSSKSIGMYHSIPVSRTELFVSKYLAGLTVMLIPYVIAGILVVAATSLAGVGAMKEAFMTAGAVLCETVFFFSLATFIAHIVSNLVALPIFYLLITFLEDIYETIFGELVSQYYFGVYSTTGDKSIVLSPLNYICQRISYSIDYPADGRNYNYNLANATLKLNNLHIVWWFALAGVVLAVISLILYKNRRSEVAGDVVAFKVIKPIFLVVCTIIVATALGFVFYGVFTLNGVFPLMEPFRNSVAMIIAGTLGYYAILMMLDRTVRVFNKKSTIGVTVLSVLYICLNIIFANDVFKIERYIPNPDEIESLEFNLGDISLEIDGSDEAAIAKLEELQGAFLDARNLLLKREPSFDTESVSANYHYKLKNGRVINRGYYGIIEFDDCDVAGTFENKYKELINSDEIKDAVLKTHKDERLVSVSISIESPEDSIYESLMDDEARGLYDAFKKDLLEGYISVVDMGYSYGRYYNVRLDFCYEPKDKSEEGLYYYQSWYGVNLNPNMKNTVEYIEKFKIATEEDIVTAYESMPDDDEKTIYPSYYYNYYY